MNKILKLLLIALCISCNSNEAGSDVDCVIDNTTSDTRIEATEALLEESVFTEIISEDERIFTVNNIPDRSVAPFPNSLNPNTITSIDEILSIDLTPSPDFKLQP